MPLEDFVFTYGGYTFGAGQTTEVAVVEGLDQPGVRSADAPRTGVHGLHPGDDHLEGRSVALQLEVAAANGAALDTELDKLAEAFAPGGDESPLVYKLPGAVEKRVVCRPRRRAMTVDVAYELGLATVHVELFATDPRIYAEQESTLTFSLPTASGGLSWPLTWPLAWGSATSSGALADNAGTFRTYPTVRFDGPLESPTLENVQAGKTFRIAGSLLDGEFLVVDFDARSVLLGGTATRRNLVAADSKWWDLLPGTNELKLGGSGGTGTATVTWRSAWL